MLIVAGFFCAPFQIHSETPPPRRRVSRRARGVDRMTETASTKFDLPEPFGPIKTFSRWSGVGFVSGPKERKFRSVISRTRGAPGCSPPRVEMEFLVCVIRRPRTAFVAPVLLVRLLEPVSMERLHQSYV